MGQTPPRHVPSVPRHRRDHLQTPTGGVLTSPPSFTPTEGGTCLEESGLHARIRWRLSWHPELFPGAGGCAVIPVRRAVSCLLLRSPGLELSYWSPWFIRSGERRGIPARGAATPPERSSGAQAVVRSLSPGAGALCLCARPHLSRLSVWPRCRAHPWVHPAVAGQLLSSVKPPSLLSPCNTTWREDENLGPMGRIFCGAGRRGRPGCQGAKSLTRRGINVPAARLAPDKGPWD